ncbi:ABC transporter permease [Actinacidiphila glaucinigra]|uniref:ABC-type nitrate/sulfonate/bicarbonate transport system, permease component n=1 Tax=Actinacidiphila glaucinigra TaxID=235986 RepID=A0A239BML1_9ACTN|nr:ABC transporter permease [Actinacidiphila glaucinigra]SNS08862.1 ABC-type nitrate/sulfonate/bicarbonate transport system, permease component [Actinacidiphila glaucinigra]
MTGRDAAYGAAGLAVLFGVAEAVPRLGLVSRDFLPPASEILRTLGHELTTRQLWSALGDTMSAWALGLAIAFVLAVALGTLIDAVPGARAATASTVEFLRPIPSVALIPLATLLFGADLGSSLLLIVYAAFWQVLIQVLYGVADVDPVARETARSYRLGHWTTLRRLVWPTALPYVMTGLRLAASVAFILAVTAELVIGSPGLGLRIQLAQSGGAVATVYALITLAGIIGVVVNLAVRSLERRLLAWHPSVRGEAAA